MFPLFYFQSSTESKNYLIISMLFNIICVQRQVWEPENQTISQARWANRKKQPDHSLSEVDRLVHDPNLQSVK